MLGDSLGFIQAPLNATLHAGNTKSTGNNETLLGLPVAHSPMLMLLGKLVPLQSPSSIRRRKTEGSRMFPPAAAAVAPTGNVEQPA